jgi:hypothetical protein
LMIDRLITNVRSAGVDKCLREVFKRSFEESNN